MASDRRNFIKREKREKADFVAAKGLEVNPLPHCIDVPVTTTPEEQAQADANGIVLGLSVIWAGRGSRPIGCQPFGCGINPVRSAGPGSIQDQYSMGFELRNCTQMPYEFSVRHICLLTVVDFGIAT
ncbi:hypothetical protein B0H19DRAFT_1071591 [Mycena capillaripes]|nr:hypothetical protein B0H19DRAFT_1071591 [Mycena capillaripes]